MLKKVGHISLVLYLLMAAAAPAYAGPERTPKTTVKAVAFDAVDGRVKFNLHGQSIYFQVTNNQKFFLSLLLTALSTKKEVRVWYDSSNSAVKAVKVYQ